MEGTEGKKKNVENQNFHNTVGESGQKTGRSKISCGQNKTEESTATMSTMQRVGCFFFTLSSVTLLPVPLQENSQGT